LPSLERAPLQLEAHGFLAENPGVHGLDLVGQQGAELHPGQHVPLQIRAGGQLGEHEAALHQLEHGPLRDVGDLLSGFPGVVGGEGDLLDLLEELHAGAVLDDIQEKLEHGLLDIGFLVDPVEVRKYEFLRLPFQERWGVLARKDSKLAGKEAVTPKDLAEIPLLLGRRELVKNELASWFGEVYEQLSVPITYNLITNAAALVRSGAGAAICVEHAGVTYTDLQFIPLSPVLETGIVLVWKKNQLLLEAVGRFIQYVKNAF